MEYRLSWRGTSGARTKPGRAWPAWAYTLTFCGYRWKFLWLLRRWWGLRRRWHWRLSRFLVEAGATLTWSTRRLWWFATRWVGTSLSCDAHIGVHIHLNIGVIETLTMNMVVVVQTTWQVMVTRLTGVILTISLTRTWLIFILLDITGMWLIGKMTLAAFMIGIVVVVLESNSRRDPMRDWRRTCILWICGPNLIGSCVSALILVVVTIIVTVSVTRFARKLDWD